MKWIDYLGFYENFYINNHPSFIINQVQGNS